MLQKRLSPTVRRPRPASAARKEVKTTVIRPQTDIVAIANKCERKMPRTFRYFMRRFGSDKTVQQDFISTMMFHPE
jgi:hypothetical protein